MPTRPSTTTKDPSTPASAPESPQEATVEALVVQTPPSITQALSAVSRDVGAVTKDRTAPGNIGGFQFRGVDDVVNAVHPVLARHGVVLLPEVLERQAVTVATRQGGTMLNVVVRTRFRFHGPAGDHLDVTTYGEAADAGDKATSKAQSVALRVALLQALMLPTNEPDPDSTGYERAGAPVQQNQQHPQQQRQDTEQRQPPGQRVFSTPDPDTRPRAATAWREVQVLSDEQATAVRARYPQGWPHPTSLDEEQADQLLAIIREALDPDQAP